MFTVTTVSPTGDANTQVFVFTVDGADIQFTVDSHSFDPVTQGSTSGQHFAFTALLEDGAMVTKVGTAAADVSSANGKVSWTGDPQVTPTVLAKEGEKVIAWEYAVPITVQDANGFTATQTLRYEILNPTADANFPYQLELEVYPGAQLNPYVTGAKVSVSAVTASGTVALTGEEIETLVDFTSSNQDVLTVGEDGAITVKVVGAATITATYKTGKDLGEGKSFKPRGILPVSVVAEAKKPAPTLRVDSVSADSITVELGPVNAASVTLSLASSSQSASLTTGLDGSQRYTFSGLSAGSDYEITATPAGSYYAPASVRATTDLPVPAGAIYTVTYAQDGADSGSAPIDPNRYAKDDEVKLLVSATPLTRNGAEVLGFSTAPNGGGDRYLYADMTEDAPHTFAMGEADVTLYPIWPSGGSSGGGGGGSTAKEPAFSGGQGWDAIADALPDLSPGEKLTVDMNGATQLPAEVLAGIAGKDVTLELDMGGGATWIIQGADLPAGASPAALELGIKTNANTIPVEVIDAATGEASTMQLELTHNGPFGIELTLRLALGDSHAGRWANLYYYNAATAALEFQARAKIAAQGWADLPFDHASSYAVIIDDVPHGGWENPFTDVAGGDWFYEAVEYVHTYGIMTGTSATTFSPDVTTSRGMIVTMLHRLAGSPETPDTGTAFQDVAPAQYYAPAVAWASAEGIVDGYGDGRFGPDDPITREQLAAMIFRFAESQGLDMSAAADLSRFTDAAKISDWAGTAMAWAVEQGLLSGKGGGVLDPQGKATRAEAATMLMRCACSLNT